MTRNYLWASVAVLAGVIAPALALADISIGAVGPMSGQYAVFGDQMRAGAELAVADINAAGGLNGEKVVLEIGDDQCDAEQAVAVANQMVGKGVAFVAGHFCSEASIAASAVYAKAGIVEISPATAHPAFTDQRPGPGIFRLHGRADAQAKVAGEYLAGAFKDERIALLHDRTAYGKGLVDATKDVMNDAGKSEALYEAYYAGQKDYSGLISRLKSERIDVVYLGGYHADAGLIKRQMVEQGLDIVLVSGDALGTEAYWAISGPAGEGTLMTLPPNPRENVEAASVAEALEAEGKPADSYALTTYAAVQVWADAVKRAGTPDFDPVVEALNAGTFETVLGTLTFDKKGDMSLPGYVWYVWKDGVYDRKSLR
ncbi:branched-chain amino acid ABC transporter substrate-binding protein [Roseibium algae]|uniref:Branched-chain amino acid ABC transporter substrate-binding protein n=1 Tax=Roseibium algae TaxID=3123038 RepID=A0ABU8TNV1_9HYPH